MNTESGGFKTTAACKIFHRRLFSLRVRIRVCVSPYDSPLQHRRLLMEKVIETPWESFLNSFSFGTFALNDNKKKLNQNTNKTGKNKTTTLPFGCVNTCYRHFEALLRYCNLRRQMIMNPLFYLVAEIKVKRLSFNFLLVLIPYLINSFFL